LSSVDGDFQSMDEKFRAVDGEFPSVDGRFQAEDGEFASMDGKLPSVDYSGRSSVLVREVRFYRAGRLAFEILDLRLQRRGEGEKSGERGGLADYLGMRVKTRRRNRDGDD
jgi:hypothetical protein